MKSKCFASKGLCPKSRHFLTKQSIPNYSADSEYTLMTAGSDWPTMESLSELDAMPHLKRSGPFNPIRRAARWIKNFPGNNQ